MDDQNDSNEIEINDGDLLEEANNILSLLGYSQKLEDEEKLFLDDFYVSIIGNLLTDIQPEISPGETKKEKAEIMDKLIETLSQAIEVDLKHINGAAIILEHDKYSAKNLLDLILELIKTIFDNNLEEEEEEEKKIDNSDKKKIDENNIIDINNDNNYVRSSEKKDKHNLDLSESNELNKNIEIFNDDEEDENNIKKENIIEEINYGEPDPNDKKNINKSDDKKEEIKKPEKVNDNQNNINILTKNSTKSSKINSNEKEKEKQLSSSKKQKKKE